MASVQHGCGMKKKLFNQRGFELVWPPPSTGTRDRCRATYSGGSFTFVRSLPDKHIRIAWNRANVAGKTVSLSLSLEQFQAMKQAVSNHRVLRKTLDQMERISRQILFQNTIDTRRRKRLSKKVLGTI